MTEAEHIAVLRKALKTSMEMSDFLRGELEKAKAEIQRLKSRKAQKTQERQGD